MKSWVLSRNGIWLGKPTLKSGELGLSGEGADGLRDVPDACGCLKRLARRLNREWQALNEIVLAGWWGYF